MRQFIESLKRLYVNGKLDKEKVITLFKDGKITENEKEYILGV
jgi:hypothetical protein